MANELAPEAELHPPDPGEGLSQDDKPIVGYDKPLSISLLALLLLHVVPVNQLSRAVCLPLCFSSIMHPRVALDSFDHWCLHLTMRSLVSRNALMSGVPVPAGGMNMSTLLAERGCTASTGSSRYSHHKE